MDRNEAASIIKRYLTCTDIMHNCNGKCTLCRYYPSDEEKESALKLAIEALEQAPTALDHIHNVVAEREYQRGYEQAKGEYDHKLTVIKRTIKDYWYIKGKEDGKADAINWIPVTEGYPKKKGEYLVTYHPCYWGNVQDVKCVGIDTFRGKTSWAKNKYQKVIAWAEKPEPWKGE